MLVTTSQAAEIMNVSSARVRILLKQGRIEGAFKIGKFWAIPLYDGRPLVKKGSRGPKPKWRNPSKPAITHAKIRKQDVGYNAEYGTNIPVIGVKKGKNNAMGGHEVDINGPCRIIYSQKPNQNRGGARVWLETLAGVEVFLKDFATGTRTSLGFA